MKQNGAVFRCTLSLMTVFALSGCFSDSDNAPVPQPVPVASDDAALSALSAPPAVLAPVFSPGTTGYSATVASGIDSVQVSAQPRDTDAALALNGSALSAGAPGRSVSLQTGSNVLTIVVTAADAVTTRSYELEIIREAEAPSTSIVQLLVLDTAGAPVNGAAVSADGETAATLTDEEGRAIVEAPSIEAAMLRLSRAGFVDQLVRMDLSQGSDPAAPLRVGMVRRAAAQNFAADQAVTLLGADGARVELPANAFVDADGNPVSGEIQAYITPLDVSDDAALAAFPGSFAARGPAGEPGSLITLGVVDFTFEQNGERLQLAAGQIATIEVPIYVTENATGDPVLINDLIPLWVLDESDGIWNWEGDALVAGAAGSPTGLALRGDARHFSWWNADIFVGRVSGAPGAVVFESAVQPTLYCDQIGTACDVGLAGGGAWVTATILRSGAPRFSTNRWVPFGGEAVQPITIPINFDIDLQAAVADGFYAVASVAPSPVRSDVGGEVIEVDVLLQPRHVVNDGLFVPGERLRGYLEVLDEMHAYRFQGRAGRVFRLRGYPAADAGSGPGITSDLGASVRVWRDDELLAEAPFDATTVAEIEVTLPTDGEYRVTFTADGKVPGFYVATTALLFAQAQAGGTVAFPARSPQLGIGLYTMNEAGDGYVRLTPPGITTTCLSPASSNMNCAALNQSPANSGRGDGYAPGFRPGFFREVAPGQILYVSDHDRPGFADLFSLDVAEPGLATRLSGPEIAGPEGYGVIDFRTIQGRPERVIYKVTEPVSSPSALLSGALYVVDPAQPEQRRAIQRFDQRPVLEYEVSNDGRWIVYKGRDTAIAVITGDLYAVDLDNPAAPPVPVNPPLDFVGGERMGSFAISPDNRRVTYSVLENVSEGVTRRQAYLADLEAPGTPIRISAEINTRTMEARFTPDGTGIVYRNASGSQTLQGPGTLFLVDLSDPLQPSAPFTLAFNGVLSPEGWQIMPQGDRVVEVTSNRVYGYTLLDLELGRVDREELLRLPSGLRFRGQPVLTGGGTGILLQVEEGTANLPWGLIHHRFGDPLTEYRMLFEAADFEDGSQGVAQMALSPDETTVIALIGIRSASAERRILSVPLPGDRVIAELVPGRDEAQDLTLRAALDTDRWYQFLPCGEC